MKKILFRLVCITFFTFLPLIPFAGCNSHDTTGYPQSIRIALFGDNQIGYKAWKETEKENPSSANIPQLRQTVADIANSSPLPNLSFILGDLVMNEADDDGETLQIQLNAWQEIYSSFQDAELVSLIPVPGNHEVNTYYVDLHSQAPNPGATKVWVEWFTDKGYDFVAGNGPVPTEHDNPDHLVRDESKLTYSFDIFQVHIVIINTDTMNTETDPETGLVLQGWIPINWIEEDIRAAQRDPRISTILVIGHRPIEPPPYFLPAENVIIINSQTYPFGDRLAQVMQENPKVTAYLASHAHSWHAFRLKDGLGVWQIMAGNAGVSLDKDWVPSGGPYFGYSLLDVHVSGKIILKGYGRPLPPPPQKFYEDHPIPPAPATLREEIVIYNPAT